MKGDVLMENQVYMASDIQKVLGIGKTKTYEFLISKRKVKSTAF